MDKYEFFIDNNSVILKYISVIFCGIFLLIILIKLVISPFMLNVSDFRFIDLLTLILALFSMSLSAAFYFKSTDQSNQFYNSSVNFTRNISEILGRIEGVFGERLKHLDEGYQGIRDAISPLKKEIEAKQNEITTISEKSDTDIIEFLRQKKVEPAIIKDIEDKFKDKDEVIKKKNEDIKLLTLKLETKSNSERNRIDFKIKHFLRNVLKDNFHPIKLISINDDAEFDSILQHLISNYRTAFINDMKHLGYITENNQLSLEGRKLIADIINNE